MKGKIMLIGIIAMIAMLSLLLAGCEPPTCYPPNKIIGNKCCMDSDSNNICDYEENETATATTATESKETEETETELTSEESAGETETAEETAEAEPQIQKITVKPTTTTTATIAKTAPTYGKMKIAPGEPHKFLQIEDMKAYRSSRDRGTLDYFVLTVRNAGIKDITPKVRLFFETARIENYEARVEKEYMIPTLKPGEKYVTKQLLGIKFSKINETKKMTLTMLDRYDATDTPIEVLKKEFVPTDYMDDLTIYTFGPPEYK
jgi:hypothetical protein